MPSKSVHQWMSHEMARLSMKLERYKPTCSGYNRIQPILLSRSVTQMLNNPLPSEDQIGGSLSQQQGGNCRGVLSRSESEWEEVYPTVMCSREQSCESYVANEASQDFAYYRNCSTRIT